MKRISFVYHHINAIGGVEIAILNLIKKLKEHYLITVAYTYNDSDFEMLNRMSKHAEVVNLNYESLEVDTVIYCSIYCIKDNIRASKEFRWVHGCLTDMKCKLPKENISEYISVGRVCKEQLDAQLKDQESTLIYNELNSDILKLSKEKIKGKKHPLHLVTVSRISPEKGFERMLKISEQLTKNKIDYIWDIVGAGYNKAYEKKIIELAPKEWNFTGQLENPFPYIKRADFLLQLSDYEAFGYVLLEALVLGTTVITTDYSSASEMINETNGHIIKKDLSDYNVNIFEQKKEFSHEHKTSIKQWQKLLQ